MRTAVIISGKVANVIEASAGFNIPGATMIASETAAIGDTYKAGKFISPAPSSPSVPQAVTRRQILTALGSLGWISETEAEAALTTGARPGLVDAVISQIPAAGRFEARMKWAGFQQANRDDDMVAALAVASQRNGTAIDALFVKAAAIV